MLKGRDADGHFAASGQKQEDGVLPADAMLLQISVYPAGQLVKLPVGHARLRDIVPKRDLLRQLNKVSVKFFQK